MTVFVIFFLVFRSIEGNFSSITICKVSFMQLRVVYLILFLFCAAQAVLSQVKLPDSPPGKTVKEYVEAFNSGDDATMKSFFLRHVSKEGLTERPVEMRVERMKMFRSNAKSLTLIKLLDETKISFTVLATDGNGESLTMSFEFDDNDQHSLAGIRIEMGEQQTNGGPTLTRREFVAEVQKYLDEQVSKNAFSGAVLIHRRNDELFKQAYGEAEKRFHIPNRIDTKFNIGSISKYFTRVAIGQLIEQGKLSLNDNVGMILLDYPNKAVAQKVTIQHLLAMQSGMGDFFREKFDNAAKDKISSLQDYLPFFVNDTLLFEPGTDRRYSNAGFIVLGLIVEKLSDENYYLYMNNHVFKPAGMKNSGWYPLSSVTPNVATGYLHSDMETMNWVSNVHMLPERGSSAGGSYATLDDIVLFIQALLNGKLLSAKYSQWVVSGEIPTKLPSLPLKEGGIGIAGGTAGVNAAVEFDAKTGDVIVVLSNYDPPSAEETSRMLSGFLNRLK